VQLKQAEESLNWENEGKHTKIKLKWNECFYIVHMISIRKNAHGAGSIHPNV
jgi:hypothetical protein